MALEKEGYRATYLPVDREGLLKLADLEAAITDQAVDVARAAKAGGPGLIGFHYSLIQADEEEGQVFPLTFNSYPTVMLDVLVAT
jgi:hypothetical protein